jgi:hypothetical protein
MRDLGNPGRAFSYQARQITRHRIWGAISFPESRDFAEIAESGHLSGQTQTLCRRAPLHIEISRGNAGSRADDSGARKTHRRVGP